MSQKIFRFVLLGLAAGLMLGAITGCFFGGGGEEEPTPDLPATIDAAVREASPTETPTPEPTDTPAPATPDVAATVAAMLAANRPTAVPPTNTPEPTDTPAPTDTPEPTDTPVPTNTPVPDLRNIAATNPQIIPAIITGIVTRNGNPVPNARVEGRSPGDTTLSDTTDDKGRYSLSVGVAGVVLELYVNGQSTGVSSNPTVLGARQAKLLSIQ